MATRLSFDTSFLIDLQREQTRSRGEGPAHAFLRLHVDALLCVSTVALAEFAEGFASPDHPLVAMVRESYELLPVDAEVALAYARLARRLRSEGRLVGSNDLWIAATSVTHGLALVADNAGHFERVPGLRLLKYR